MPSEKLTTFSRISDNVKKQKTAFRALGNAQNTAFRDLGNAGAYIGSNINEIPILQQSKRPNLLESFGYTDNTHTTSQSAPNSITSQCDVLMISKCESSVS